MKLPISLFALAALTLAAALAQEQGYTPDPGWAPPADAAARKNPLSSNPEAAGGGRKLYLRNCSECHGGEGLGTDAGPGLHLEVVQEQSDGALFWKMTNGNSGRGMPSWSRLPEAQRWQLILFLRTLPRKSPQ